MIFKKKLYIKGMDVKQNKNKRILALVAPIAIGVTLCACGSENVAGGGPSGTEAGNAITAQIFIADAPAANARVKLVEQTSLDGQGYIATANENGVVMIKDVPIGNYTMEAILNKSSIQLPVSVQNLDDTVELGPRREMGEKMVKKKDECKLKVKKRGEKMKKRKNFQKK